MSGFNSRWLEQHQAKKSGPKKAMPNDRATKLKARKELERLGAEAKERDAIRIAGNRAALSGKRTQVVIGIDPGVKTGMGIYHNGELVDVVTTTIIEAIDKVKRAHKSADVMVYVEDARMATYGRRGKQSMAQAQGAGSIKRDCKIWETELTRLEIPHKMVRPNKQSNQIAENKKLWQQVTGWTKRSSEHARDAVLIAKRFVK